MKKLAFVTGVAALCMSAVAGSAVADGTDFVVTADAGESYTYSTAIGNYARLVKRGAGEVVLTAATTAFKGEVLVEVGTLSITDRTAVGTGTPVTVQDGATFWLKIPHPTGNQASAVFTGHKMTIAGKGVDGKGAIRYTRTSASGSAKPVRPAMLRIIDESPSSAMLAPIAQFSSFSSFSACFFASFMSLSPSV
jgi:autotransporter-associated beta strand protein